MQTIPYGKQNINSSDLKEVSKSLKNPIITTGKKVLEFEKKLQKYFNCKFVTTCNSGTSALYLACLSINLNKSDIILMPSINFISSFNIATSMGAKVYLVDVDTKIGQITPQNVEETCKKYKIKKFKALIAMYNGGYPSDCEKYIKLKKKYGFYFIEDACHALGAYYKIENRKYMIGSCKHADISTFSLHPLKTITTGEGGIVTTNNKVLDNKLKKFRSLGIQRNNKKHWDYNVNFNGFNFRLTDFQCALGINQLSRVNKFLNKRRKLKLRYDLYLKKIEGIKFCEADQKYYSSNHLYLISISNKSIEFKEKFIKFMLSKKIFVQYHYIPIYKFKIFNKKIKLRNAESYYKASVSLPIYYDLSFKDQKKIIMCIKAFFEKHY